MKLMVSAKPFTADLKSVLPATATRSGLPMLSGVRLETSDGEVAIEATDLELTARRAVRGDVTVDGAGSVVVPAKALVKAVAAMSEPEIVLESHSSDGRAGLDVRAGTRTVTLQGWPADDWPAVPRVAAIEPIASIDAQAAADAFERVALCASDDDSRPVLTCVALFFEEDPPTLEVVSTDSYRLGVARLPLEAGFRVSDGPLLVPARAIRLLAKQLKRAEGAVQVRALEASGEEPSRASRIAFSFPDAEWTVRSVEGEFPNWKQVVPHPERWFVRVRSGRARLGPASRDVGPLHEGRPCYNAGWPRSLRILNPVPNAALLVAISACAVGVYDTSLSDLFLIRPEQSPESGSLCGPGQLQESDQAAQRLTVVRHRLPQV